MTDAVLRTEHLNKAFPGIQALDDVSIEIRAKEVVGLVGENGAGKSTLLKVLAGLYPADSGRTVLRGRDIILRGVAAAADAGIGMVFQEQSLLPNITVAENILLGHEGAAVRNGLYNWNRLYQLAATQLDKLGSKISPAAQTESLSFTERQVVELAKVLAIEERTHHEPIILLDEPTSVLEADEIETVLAHIERLRDRASVIFVSHRLDEVLRVSDRVYVMTNGRCVAERNPKNCDVGELQLLMLGRELRSAYDKKAAVAAQRGVVCLSVRELTRRGAYEEVSFELHAGEVLGFAGVLGSGREALCRTIFGAEDAEGGEFLVDNTPMRFADPADAIRSGIGYLPAERRTEGIIGGLSVKENMTLAHLHELMRGPVIDHKREDELANRWIDRLRIKTRSPETPATNLSGGNQQKVVLTKWLIAKKPRILILDHPMRGLDVGAKAEIFALVRELARGGIGILLIADTLEELIALSDAIIVMRDGRISGRFSNAESPPTPLQILERMV
jgi:ribose transport system ATP-binding protein